MIQIIVTIAAILAIVSPFAVWVLLRETARAGREEMSYRAGYTRGHREGYDAGLRNRKVQR